MNTNGLPRVLTVIAVLLVSFVSVVAVPDFKPETPGPEGERAFRELGIYYGDHYADSLSKTKRMPDFKTALDELGGGDAAKREAAGRYLLALFEQSFADEVNGRTGWWRYSEWRGSSPAGSFRKELAAAFGEKARGEAAFDTVQWIAETEVLSDVLAAAAKVLPRIESPRMAKLIEDMLAQPHPNGALATAAVEEADRRGLTALAPRVRGLCTHYRDSVRNAARKSALARIGGALPEFQPAEAFSPWLVGQLARIRSMVPVAIPAKAVWCEVRGPNFYIPSNGTEFFDRAMNAGWLLSERRKEFDFLHCTSGGIETLLKSENRRIPRKLAATARDVAIAQEFTRAEERKGRAERGDPPLVNYSLAIEVKTGLVAAWCYERGERAAAAEALFPSINAAPDDRWLTWDVRDGLGDTYDGEMLDAFVFNRDYAAAIKLADHLGKPAFDGYQFQERARELAVQLRQRGGDFKTLRLPAVRDWEKLRKTMSRAEQAAYLTARFRLLNCFQTGNTEPPDFGTAQFATFGDPWSDDKKSATPLINPYMELLKMKLTAVELPPVVALLTDDSFIPTLCRGKGPNASLYRANEMVAEIINNTAKRELAEYKNFEHWDAARRAQHIEKLLAWCRENAAKSPADLLLETLASHESAFEVDIAAGEAARDKIPGAAAVIIGRMKDFPDNRDRLAELVYACEDPTVVDAVREWVKSDSIAVQFCAAMILLRDGDKAKNEGFAELESVLKSDAGSGFYSVAVKPLLARKDEASLLLACGILKTKDFGSSYYDRLPMRPLMMTGRQEVLDFLMTGLGDKTVTSIFQGRTQVRGDSIAVLIAGCRKDKWEFESNASDKARAAKREELKRWLPKLFVLIRKGKPVPLDAP